MKKIFIFLLIASSSVYGSSFQKCNILVQVERIAPDQLQKVISIKYLETGFGKCSIREGQKVNFSINDVKVGDKIWLEFMEYSGMGPDGPVSGKSFKRIKSEN